MPSAVVVVAAIAITVVASLSIHVVMLQILWVPYPDTGHLGRLGMLYPLAQSLGMIWLAAATAPTLCRVHPVLGWLIVAALFAGMNGALRNALMEGVTTTGYLAPLAGLVRQLVFDLLLAGLAIGIVRVVPYTIGRIVGAVVLTAVMLFLGSPVLGTVLAPLFRWAATHAHPEVFQVPYGANVLVPSYLSFTETVVACLIARFMVAFRTTAWDPAGLARYAVLVLFVRGTLMMMVVFGPMIGAGPGDGMLSVSQFFLQDIAMIVLVHMNWRYVMGSRSTTLTPHTR